MLEIQIFIRFTFTVRQQNLPQAPANNTNVVKILLIVGAAVFVVMLLVES